MSEELFLTTETLKVAESVLQLEDWPQISICFLRKECPATPGVRIYWRVWSNSNKTSHVCLNLNTKECCIDLIELVGRFKIQHMEPGDESITSTVSADPRFDFLKSGFLDEGCWKECVDSFSDVRLQLFASSVIVPLRERKSTTWCYTSATVALGHDENGALVALLFDQLTPEQRKWFEQIGEAQ